MSYIKSLASIVALIAFAMGSTVPAAADPYEVQIENLIPGGVETGQPFTPPVIVVHDAGYVLFAAGDFASAGLELLAEDGVTADLVTEAMASPSVQSVVVGSGPFFDVEIVPFNGMPGDHLSLVTMLARSNDLFTGVAGAVLPASGSVVFEPTGVYDAGTEENTGFVEHIPFYGSVFVGPDEDNAIAMVASYEVVNDPDHKRIPYEFPPSARITITRLDPTPTDASSWGEIKSLFR